MHFNTSLSVTDRIVRQKINKEIEDMNSIINLLDLTGIYRIFHPSQQNTPSSVHMEDYP